MTKNVVSIILLMLLSYQFLNSQSQVKNSNYESLNDDIEALINSEKLNEAHVGIKVFSLDKQEVLYSYNSDKNFVPASINKLITTAAAIDYLGAEFKYYTKLYLDGNIEGDGEFKGNIILRGYGDPTLSKEFYKKEGEIFDDWCFKLDSLGIKTIKGNIIGDDNYFDDVYYPSGWAWDDLKYSYSAQVNSLSYSNNTVTVKITSGENPNESANLNVQPNTDYVRIVNNIKSSKEFELNEIHFDREAITNFYEFFGHIVFDPNQRDTIVKEISIDNPTLYFLNIFSNHLRDFNIRFKGALLDIDDWIQQPVYFKINTVFERESAPLEEIIKVANKESINLIAEILFKTIAKEKGGEGSFNLASKYLDQFVKKFHKENDYNIVDGSGLSRLNFYSPNLIIDLLRYINNSEYKNVFLNSLAKPGEEGTLERRLKNSTAKNRVFAKTGTMNGVSNISGYVVTNSGDILAVSMFFNNFSLPQSEINNIQDLILMRLSSIE